MTYRVRLFGFVATIALLTTGAVALNTAAQSAGLPLLRLAAGAFMLVLPGTVYVRMHPMWRSRGASARQVGAATAAGVFIGMMTTEIVFRVLLALGLIAWSPTTKHAVGVIVLAVAAAVVGFLVAADTYRKAGAASLRPTT